MYFVDELGQLQVTGAGLIALLLVIVALVALVFKLLYIIKEYRYMVKYTQGEIYRDLERYYQKRRALEK